MDLLTGIRAFDKRTGQLFYIVPVTYGYIFTLSGDMAHFWLAVAALVTSKLTKEMIEYGHENDASLFRGDIRLRYLAIFLLAALTWLGLYVGANVAVARFFRPPDLVVVGLGIAYAGLAVYGALLLVLKVVPKRG